MKGKLQVSNILSPSFSVSIAHNKSFPLPVSTSKVIEGELVSGYTSLEEAESQLIGLEDQGQSLRLKQVAILQNIRDNRLYTQKKDPYTEEYYGSMEEYFRALCRDVPAFAGDAPRTLKSWMTRKEVFCDQLGKSEDWLLTMGAHAERLLPAANRGHDMQLRENNEDTESGGEKLGKDDFIGLVKEVEENVFYAKEHPEIPEAVWPVRATAARVKEVLGTDTTETSFAYTAKVDKDENYLLWTDVVLFIGGVLYKVGDKVPRDAFERITSNKLTIK